MSALTHPRRRVRTAAAKFLPVRAALPWLLGSLGLTMSALIGQVPLWALAIFAVCAAWRQWLELRNRELPSLAVRLAVFVPSGAGVILTYGTNLGAPGLLTFLTALLSLKVLELRSPRDLTIVALLGYFMLLSAFFYDQSLVLSLYLTLAVLGNAVALILCHGAGHSRPFWPTLRLATGMCAQALPLVVLLFLIFPRVQGTFLRSLGGGSTGQTGMSEHLEPGSFSSLVQNDQMAFRAAISGGTPAGRDLYWRAVVLDLCEHGLSWRASSDPWPFQPRYAPLTAKLPANTVEQRITLMPHGRRWLFALDRPVDIAPSSSLKPQLMKNNLVRSQNPIITKAIYTVYSQLSHTDAPEVMTPALRVYYTQLPDGLGARVLQLADGWKQQARSTEDIVRAAQGFFGDGSFAYTLTPGRLPSGGAALEQFLFRTRRGFCEHYAGAFSTLMRAAGVPARIVIGYQGGEYNTWGGYYTVRQSDAHAWAEIWIDGQGWQRQDPTALVAPDRVNFGAGNFAALSGAGGGASRLGDFGGAGGWRWAARNVLQAWDSVDQQWNLLVLGYDQEQQLNLMQSLGLGEMSWLGSVTLALAGIFSILALSTLGMRVFTRDRRAAQDPAQRLYQRFRAKAAAAAALPQTATEGPLDFAKRIGGALPAHTEEIARITQLYIASRYAAPAGTGGADVLDGLRRAVSAFHPREPKD
jgi:transglutaminase-like putative cysteine protease